ncbi:hypothetical protein MMC10_010350 [Thelotrema lepadinum]|nr:hypothetical protein [Thelotrema lepadinum]
MGRGEDTKDEYVFKRDEQSSIRLNYHHLIIKHLCGYLIHPSVPIQQSSFRVADIGCGTGIWAIETAESLPKSAQIQCFDISTEQFPPEGAAPANVSFHEHNAFEAFPESCQEQFDLVSMRFLLTVVNESTAATLLRNAASLLKSGGHLQWLEPDMSTTTLRTSKASLETAAVERMIEMMKKPSADADTRWVKKLPQIFLFQGLDVIQETRHTLAPGYRVFMSQTQLMALEDFCGKLEQAGDLNASEQVRREIDLVRDEMRRGVTADTEHVCVVGRKL